MNILNGRYSRHALTILTERYSGCQIQDTKRFIQDIQEGQGPDDLLTTS